MEPAHPPFPTASYFRFQFASGIQNSTLMSESGVGFRVAATRQNAGSSLRAPVRALAVGSPGPGRNPSGSVNSPAGTDCASVMKVSGIANLASVPQGDGAASASSGRNSTKIIFSLERLAHVVQDMATSILDQRVEREMNEPTGDHS